MQTGSLYRGRKASTASATHGHLQAYLRQPGAKRQPPGPPWLPPDGGTYVLWLRLPSARRIVVGRLGTIDFARGCYAYVGSAQGPGGLAARVGRHLGGSARRRWHIDFLRRVAAPVAVWYHVSDRRLEHQWAAALAAMPGASLPVPGFGASDCRCQTHLMRFGRLPALRKFKQTLKNFDPALAPPFVEVTSTAFNDRQTGSAH